MTLANNRIDLNQTYEIPQVASRPATTTKTATSTTTTPVDVAARVSYQINDDDDPQGLTALHVAVKACHWDMVKLFVLDQQCNPYRIGTLTLSHGRQVDVTPFDLAAPYMKPALEKMWDTHQPVELVLPAPPPTPQPSLA